MSTPNGKPHHGGKRTGAGRPRKDADELIRLSFRMRKRDVEIIRAFAGDDSLTEGLERALREIPPEKIPKKNTRTT